MKKKLLHILSTFMAFTVLFSSTGFGMTTHTCKITQKKQFFVHNDGDCCQKSQSTEPLILKKSDCCKVEKSFSKVFVNHNFTGKVVVQSPNAFLLNSYYRSLFSDFVDIASVVNSDLYAIPPPHYGRSLLVHIQSFII